MLNFYNVYGHKAGSYGVTGCGLEWHDEYDRLDRADGPAHISYDQVTGVATIEGWWRNGKHHRADGPACILRDRTTGAITYEGWSKDGKHHRIDGPAIIRRDPTTGLVTSEEWWVDGMPITPIDSPTKAIGPSSSGLAKPAP